MRTNAERYINGTSALRMPRRSNRSNGCRIIRPDFTNQNLVKEPKSARSTDSRQSKRHAYLNRNGFRDVAQRAFEGSEMLCSLVYEDSRGCPYGVFSRNEVIGISVFIATITILVAIFGA